MSKFGRHPGDWNCPCGELNFASRSVCRSCGGQPPPDSYAGRPDLVPLSGYKGEWRCACGEVNFAARSACRKCSRGKGGEGVVVTLPPRPTLQGYHSMPGRHPGDWNCGCGELNFASRDICRKCGRAVVAERRIGRSSSECRPGDWVCGCGEHNFANRFDCRKCGVPKSQARHTIPSRHPGDWSCGFCGELNFASRDACRKCVTPRGLPRGEAEERALHGRDGEDGDEWICSCGERNKGGTKVCHFCEYLRHSTNHGGISGLGVFMQ